MSKKESKYPGQIFGGKWFVRDVFKDGKRIYCNCVCLDCGKQRQIRQDVLKSNPPICECSHKVNDYTGRVFGYLTVKSKNDDGTYLCECDCKNTVNVSSNDLRQYVKMSCGCKKQGSKLLPRVCRDCGKTFEGGTRAWYCPDCRKIRAAESKKRTAERRKNGTVAIIGGKMICEMCGQECIRNGANQRFCADCAKINERQKDREQSLRYYHDNADIINPKRYHLRHRMTFKSSTKIGSVMTCQICGKEIIRNSSNQKYCKNCQKISQNEYRQKYYKTHQLKEETIARKKEYAKQYQKNKYDEYVSNKDKYNDTTAYDAFKKAFPEVFKNIAEKYNISTSDLATTLGLSKKTTHSWKYGIVPQLKPLMYLYRQYGAEILPTIPEVGSIERKEPIEPKTDSWISNMCADAGYSMFAIAEMMHILPTMFEARYKNGIVNPKSAVDLLCLFGYKYMDKFYPQD